MNSVERPLHTVSEGRDDTEDGESTISSGSIPEERQPSTQKRPVMASAPVAARNSGRRSPSSPTTWEQLKPHYTIARVIGLERGHKEASFGVESSEEDLELLLYWPGMTVKQLGQLTVANVDNAIAAGIGEKKHK